MAKMWDELSRGNFSGLSNRTSHNASARNRPNAFFNIILTDNAKTKAEELLSTGMEIEDIAGVIKVSANRLLDYFIEQGLVK